MTAPPALDVSLTRRLWRDALRIRRAEEAAGACAPLRPEDSVTSTHRGHGLPLTGTVPEGEHLVPLGRAEVKRVGRDATVIATARMVHLALEAADALARDGISVEVVDPRSLVPLDRETVVASVAKTHRVVIAEEGPLRGGVGGHITFWHYAIDPLILAVSGETWKILTPEDREIVRKAGEEMMAWEKKAAREGLEGAMAAVDTLKKNGMEVVQLAPEQVKAFRDRTRPVYEKWTQEVGVELVRAAEKLVEANK